MQETAQQYIQRILGFIDGKDPLRVQRETPKKLHTLLKPLSKKQLTQRPEPEKWSIAEILAHLADAELTFRVLRESNLSMLKALPKNLWDNYGMHQERGKETIAHIVRMFAGHDLNHLAQVEKITKASRSKRAA